MPRILEILDPLVIPDVGPRGVIPVSRMQAPLRFEIPRWQIPEPGELPHILTTHWIINGRDTTYTETFSAPPPDIPDPVVRFIPLATLRQESGVGEIYYTIESEAGTTEMLPHLPIRVDMVAPTLLTPQDHLEFVVAPTPVVDEAYIAANAPILLRVPPYNGREVFDSVQIYASNSASPPVTAPDGVTLLQSTSDPLIASLDGAVLRRLLNGNAFLFCRFFDEAGNFSPMSAGLAFSLALTAPPTDLQLPEIRPPAYNDLLIKRDDARLDEGGGVFVRIPTYTGWASGDAVVVYFNGRPIVSQPVVTFPCDVFVPWPTLRGPAPILVAEQVPVRYEIIRGTQAPVRSAVARFNVNLTIAGQENPNAPAKLNGLLARVEIRGQNPPTLNQIDNRHRGQDVLASVALFDEPVAGQVLRLYCNGVGPVASYTVRAGDVAGRVVSFSNLPWSVFEGIANARLPFYYTTDNGFNEQRSPDTEVNVNAVPAITVSVPKLLHSLTKSYITCASSAVDGVSWLIEPNPDVKLNDEIRFKWQGFSANNWSNPIEASQFNRTTFWTAANIRQGWTVVVTPFETTLFPMRRFGSATAAYEVWRNGIQIGQSDVVRIRVDLTYAGSGSYCGPNGSILS